MDNITTTVIGSNPADWVTECDLMRQNFMSGVSFIFKITIFLMFIIVVLNWWAIDKIVNSTETDDRKRFLVKITQTFTNGLMILFIFIQLYWIFIVGLEF